MKLINFFYSQEENGIVYRILPNNALAISRKYKASVSSVLLLYQCKYPGYGKAGKG